ncbi:MAG TPA: hypothetical protein VHG27_03105 [Xanthobacteraceae bacterium]|nr:hypothetical protein [Xanthobacteraceae bacterium]
MLLAAMARLERLVRTENMATVEQVRAGLVDMAAAIDRTKAEIAALKPERELGRIEEATEELDAIVNATEKATSDILAAAERVQEVAWTLREQGVEPRDCDLLDARAIDIYTACSFQDLTGQRTRKVTQVLRYLEWRIDAMIALWNGDTPEGGARCKANGRERDLLNGPSRPGHGLEQADVDRVMQHVNSPSQPLSVSGREYGADISPATDPLASLAAMSYEEKLALFS